jgi:hypothetical protein
MSKDIKDVELPLQKVIDLGEIDRWLREILPMMPRNTGDHIQQERELHSAGYEVTHHDFNTHTMAYGTHDLIESTDIEKMVGFRRLVTACSQANMRVDVSLLGHGALEVAFNPEESFSRSRIFGASYANVLPVMFGLKNTARK